MQLLHGRRPFLKKLFADGGYQGPIFAATPPSSKMKSGRQLDKVLP